jgi:hypothetical protein
MRDQDEEKEAYAEPFKTSDPVLIELDSKLFCLFC